MYLDPPKYDSILLPNPEKSIEENLKICSAFIKAINDNGYTYKDTKTIVKSDNTSNMYLIMRCDVK